VHQTFRLTSIIEDLLLLSRLESGRLELNLAPINLSHIVETCVDDLYLLHDGETPPVENTVPSALRVAGDARYTMLIVQNILENARKYGRADTPIRVSAREEGGTVALVIANRGAPIPRGSWEHIFERFHRANVAENLPGHGLGLNLARELARLHGGDLRLLRSDEEWTEFEVCFRSAQRPVGDLAAA